MRNPRPAARTGPERLKTLCAMLLLAGEAVQAQTTAIRLNTIGFLPGEPKQATIAAACRYFTLVRPGDGQAVFSNTVAGPRRNPDTEEDLYTADFSAWREPGVFQLEAPGVGRSAPFRIGTDIYNEPFYTVMRGMYLWRCGMAVSSTNHGIVYEHAACHTNDAWLDFVGGGHVNSNSTKGWHDAGDYNKYVVNAGVTVGVMLRAWEEFGPAIRGVALHLPDARAGTPEYLTEVQWELEWLLTMQAGDGSVYHKVSTRGFGGFILPEAEETPRYFTPWGSAATAQFAAMMAMAARDYRPFEPEFADQCLKAAWKSYRFLQAHPEDHRADQSQFTTGTYQVRDGDGRLWAAAELWETTGDADCLRDFETRARAVNGVFDTQWDYGNVKNLGELTYLFSARAGRDGTLAGLLRTNLLAAADRLVSARDAHGYARPAGTAYSWGGNGVVARQVVLLQAARRLSPKPEYETASLDALGHLFGRNYYGRSFVTGVGFQPPLHPHDRRSGAQNLAEPWPGYLVGGSNPGAKNWEDVQANYRVNEIAINWNSALIYALAAFVSGTHSP
ncbi:MAG TPA: glycoside hydrolase family 9 protein [Candidatus Acidoferrum sp.]|nr:glycoside hydrolase family 9 protein [Candidatus Acidoferrum sp.]